MKSSSRKTAAAAVGSTIVLASILLGSLALLTGCPDKGGSTPSASASASTTAAPASSKAGSSGSGW